MIVKKCDRCGKIYDDSDSNRVGEYFNHTITMASYFKGEIIEGYDSLGFDLCPDCADELAKFMRITHENDKCGFLKEVPDETSKH